MKIPTKKAENLIRSFGMTNLQIQSDLLGLEQKLGIDIGVRANLPDDKDATYYPQFSEAIRNEASKMSRHYEVFYCLEKSIRALITQKLISMKGANWWGTCVSVQIQGNAKSARQKEIDSGITSRSDDLLDFTTFGELSEIITSNWDVFGDTFSSQKAVQRVMSNLNLLRGPIAHCCDLAEDEITRLQMSVKDWFRLME